MVFSRAQKFIVFFGLIGSLMLTGNLSAMERAKASPGKSIGACTLVLRQIRSFASMDPQRQKRRGEMYWGDGSTISKFQRFVEFSSLKGLSAQYAEKSVNDQMSALENALKIRDEHRRIEAATRERFNAIEGVIKDVEEGRQPLGSAKTKPLQPAATIIGNTQPQVSQIQVPEDQMRPFEIKTEKDLKDARIILKNEERNLHLIQKIQASKELDLAEAEWKIRTIRSQQRSQRPEEAKKMDELLAQVRIDPYAQQLVEKVEKLKTGLAKVGLTPLYKGAKAGLMFIPSSIIKGILWVQSKDTISKSIAYTLASIALLSPPYYYLQSEWENARLSEEARAQKQKIELRVTGFNDVTKQSHSLQDFLTKFTDRYRNHMGSDGHHSVIEYTLEYLNGRSYSWTKGADDYRSGKDLEVARGYIDHILDLLNGIKKEDGTWEVYPAKLAIPENIYLDALARGMTTNQATMARQNAEFQLENFSKNLEARKKADEAKEIQKYSEDEKNKNGSSTHPSTSGSSVLTNPKYTIPAAGGITLGIGTIIGASLLKKKNSDESESENSIEP